jgi:hypothetical protein
MDNGEWVWGTSDGWGGVVDDESEAKSEADKALTECGWEGV